MTRKTDRTRNRRGNSGSDPLDSYIEKVVHSKPPKPAGGNSAGQLTKIILACVILFVGYSIFSGNGVFLSSTPFSYVTSMANGEAASEDLLNRMNSRMTEMGYTGLSHDDLRSLRSDDVTATFISNVRSLGFTDLTLEEARRLARADASSVFMAMMIELGYDLSVDEFVQLRDAGVTAHYTSNIHDLGYREVTPEELIRMRRIGLSSELIEQLQEERSEDIPLEEIIRYRISNQ